MKMGDGAISGPSPASGGWSALGAGAGNDAGGNKALVELNHPDDTTSEPNQDVRSPSEKTSNQKRTNITG
ncbi:protein of unknown function [Methylorubrum extorquens]|uniref:Uncharacterized protein n=1 Tax=Methylorubrum extorquens TaxID=408 RepID=A0A2N9AZ15_METEX|nr:protein of unknown function [Methylorubrum extorquens]